MLLLLLSIIHGPICLDLYIIQSILKLIFVMILFLDIVLNNIIVIYLVSILLLLRS